MPAEPSHPRIDRPRLRWYFRTQILLAVVPLLVLVGLAAATGGRHVSWSSWIFPGVVALVTAAAAIWAPAWRVSALRYRLEGSTLRIDEGILFRKRKSIPLDRITDLAMVQGPLMRCFGIWAIHVQTAGSTRQLPEGVLHGLADAESARDAIMAARDRAARVANEPA